MLIAERRWYLPKIGTVSRIAIHDTNAAITQFIALREKTATNRNGKRFVGLATHISEKFFNRLRHSVEWLSDI